MVSGTASDALLDTYEVERRPRVTTLTHGSIELGKIANTHAPEQAAARNAAIKAGNVAAPPGPPPLVTGVLQAGADGVPQPPAGTLVSKGALW